MTHHILYTFRRCPFAIRARMTLNLCNILFEYREVDLKNKPPSLIEYSPKGTVPVLVTHQGEVIDESIEIMRWAMEQHDPCGLKLQHDEITHIQWIDFMQDGFLPWVYRSKYPEKYPNLEHENCLKQGRSWLDKLSVHLANHEYYVAGRLTYLDIAIFPMVRQWNHFDPLDSSVTRAAVYKWLSKLLNSECFNVIMEKQPLWVDC